MAVPNAFETRAAMLLPRFVPEMERAYQARYFADIRSTLRVASLLLAVLFLVYMARDYFDTDSVYVATRQSGAPLLFFILLFVLTFWQGFPRLWQPIIVVGGVTASALSQAGLASFLGEGITWETAAAGEGGPFPGYLVFFSLHVCILMFFFAAFRLPFRSMLPLQLGVLGAGVWSVLTWLLQKSPARLDPLSRFLQPTLLVLFAVLLSAFVQERLARRAFVANHLLDQERNDERRKREESEGKLQILGQAIGGIVHDLGNPLTSVQTGAETLEMVLDSGDVDPQTLKDLNAMIREGAQVLNYLRLSLMEETRVLEGKPIPVDLKPVPVRSIVEMGARLQKPRFVSGRTLTLTGDPAEVSADAMKLTAVFMNLIGNALKYSDGEVRVAWRPSGDVLLIGIFDQGRERRGITQAQARELFVPFGRLQVHAEVEGTGLGLLSVRKIVEAHGGEVYIEGYVDGAPPSPHFSTARGDYPTLLTAEFRTAFVVTCPLAAAS